MSESITLKELALSVGWQVEAFHITTEREKKWLLKTPNRRVYQNGRLAQLLATNVDGTPLEPGRFRVDAQLRDTEADAWADLPTEIDEITNGWKATQHRLNP